MLADHFYFRFRFDTWPPLRTHNAPAYQISRKAVNTWLSYCDWTSLPARFPKGAGVQWALSARSWVDQTKLYRRWKGYRPAIAALQECCVLQIYCCISKRGCDSSQRRLGLKVEAKFREFFAHLKFSGGMGECLSEYFVPDLRSKFRYNFDKGWQGCWRTDGGRLVNSTA